ncbi:Leptin receptor [Talaromyces islandicus]|uniref:Leptin receptor n=1 Tax=Talaromyces islandicus TaxID=28573 RepID=A0A0U1M8B2_TALIS|nr:Leptin receptor [Talaromyces islandicus]
MDGRDDCAVRSKVSDRSETTSQIANNNNDKLVEPATDLAYMDNVPFLDELKAPAFPDNTARDIPMVGMFDSMYNLDCDSNPSDGNVIYSSYSFLDVGHLSSLPKGDVEFLISKRCLHVPRKDALDEFVKQYFTVVHPFVPLINEAEFWRLYMGTGNSKKMSLFVFQAMLFSCCAFVPLEILQRCGFEDKRGARRELYKRAKTLFNLDAEDRCLAKAQGALLLSHHTSAEDPQAASIWLATAIRIAMTLESYPMLPSDDVDKPLTKRLWWAILLRDRSLSLGLRRHPQVTATNFMADANSLHEAEFEDEIRNSRVFYSNVKRQLFAALQEQCRLAVLLNDGLAIVFPPPGPLPQSHTTKEGKEKRGILQMVKSQLAQWKEQSAFFPSETSPSLHDSPDNPQSSAQISIAHFEALLVENTDRTVEKDYAIQIQEIAKNLRVAIDGLTSTIEYFTVRNTTGMLPLSVLAYAGMPLVLSAINLKLSPSYSQMLVRRNRLNTFAEVIRQSRLLYDVTDIVVAGTNQILQLAYAITKELFLRRKIPRYTNSSTSPALESRATSWDEAYLRYPRAYLYISQSVEYSLSVGRLPTEVALPEQVRHVPSIVLGTRLPWAIQSSPARHALTEKPHYEVCLTEERESEVVFGLDPILEEQHLFENWEGQNIHEDGGLPRVSQTFNSSSLTLSRCQKNQYDAGANVNLDYFDVEPV